MKKSELVLLLFNAGYIAGFGLYFVVQKNYDFLVYIGVLVALVALVAAVQRYVAFPNFVLWIFSVWGVLHMLGGSLTLLGGRVLYRWVPLELYNAHDALGEFVILKFDQILHFYVYFAMSLVLAHLLLRATDKQIKSFYFYFFVIIGSMGLSVINELVEFTAVILSPSTGVGGYFNTMLDFAFNTLGALAGALTHYLWRRKHAGD